MRHKDTELMNTIRTYIRDYYTEHRTMPSTTQIAKAHGIVRSTAYTYLRAMDKAGLISYEDGVIRDDKTSLISLEQETAAVLGSIACGNPETEEEQLECIVSLPTAVFGKGPFYLLHATGDSMADAGIEEGDLLVIRRQPEARVGDIVVALDDANENTLKEYGGIDKASGLAVLKFRNRAKYGEREIHVQSLVCQGVLTHIIKTFAAINLTTGCKTYIK